MQPRTIFVMAAALLAFCIAQAQSTAVRKGNRLYDQMAYPEAIRAYEKAPEASSASEVAGRLADCYRLLGNTAKAEYWYGRMSTLGAMDKDAMLHHAQMLQANGKYSDAQKVFEQWGRSGGDATKAKAYADACANVAQFKSDSLRFKLTRLPINGNASDFGAVSWNKGVLFSSSRKHGFFSKAVNQRNGNLFYDLYWAAPLEPGKTSQKVKPVKGKVNSRYHDGPVAIGTDGTLFLTRSSQSRDSKGVVRLKLFSAKWNGRKWDKPVELNFNRDTYSCAHPAISDDGSTLVFASDMPGGHGGTDLWMVTQSGGNWGTPVNLGASINTSGDEKFPALHPAGTLVFSSDGHPGMGGLDLFAAEMQGKGAWGKPQNIGYPINSGRDDFSLSWNGSQASGYFSSDRPGGAGEDDVYSFSRQSAIKGLIVDARTQLPISGAKVSLMDTNGKTEVNQTDVEGAFAQVVDMNKEYMVTIEREGYLPRKERLSTKAMSPVSDMQVRYALEPELKFTIAGVVLDDSTNLPIANASVKLVGRKDEKSLTTDAEGRYSSELQPDENYFVVAKGKGYKPSIAQVVTADAEPQEFVSNARLRRGHYILVSGNVTNQTTGEPVKDAALHGIEAESRSEVATVKSASDGRYFIVLDSKSPEYMLIGSRKDYFSRRVDIIGPGIGMDTTIQADLALVPYKVGEMVKVIYYDYNSSNIRRDAGKELTDIIYFLMDNPEAAVELASHTDSRGNSASNQSLSIMRSEAAVNYIIQMGIAKNRITPRGYGESKPVNTCVDGMQCDEKEHALNRRTEITVVSLHAPKGEDSKPVRTGEERRD